MKYGLIFCEFCEFCEFLDSGGFCSREEQVWVVISEVFNGLGMSVSERDMQNGWAADCLKSVDTEMQSHCGFVSVH